MKTGQQTGLSFNDWVGLDDVEFDSSPRSSRTQTHGTCEPSSNCDGGQLRRLLLSFSAMSSSSAGLWYAHFQHQEQRAGGIDVEVKVRPV